MDRDCVDFSRVLQPQADGYDVGFFLELKKLSGFVKRDIPEMTRLLGQKVKIGRWRPQSYREQIPSECDAHFDLLEHEFKKAAPVYFNMVTDLLDVLTCIECPDSIERSTLCPTVRYPGAWIIMTSISDNPAVAPRGIMHELMHQKLVALGFGTHASFVETGEEFIFNDQHKLHHSIVNSYADSMQPYMPGPIGRPMAACIHAYVSFLATAAATIKFINGDPFTQRNLRYSKRWTERLDTSWNAIREGALPTDKGKQLLQGLENWTTEYLQEYHDAVKEYGDGNEQQVA